MEAGKAFSLVAFLWLLYLLYAPASINPAPPPRPVPQVVAGRVTGTVPPPNGSWAFLRELIWACLVAVLRPILCPFVWVCLFPVKLMFYAAALFTGFVGIIVEHVSGDREFAYEYFGKGYEDIWLENPFFCIWPIFCLFSGSWPTVIAEALVLAVLVHCHPWYRAVFGRSRSGFVAAAAIVAAVGAVYYVLPDLFSHLPPLLSQNDRYLVLEHNVTTVDPDGA